MSLKRGQKLTWEAPCGHVFVQVLKNEGPKSLYLGLTPELTRSVLYGGLRLGLYEPSKYACDWAFGSTNIFFKIASGGFAGSFATALTNSIEVLKGLRPAMAKAAALTILVRWTRLEEGFNLHLFISTYLTLPILNKLASKIKCGSPMIRPFFHKLIPFISARSKGQLGYFFFFILRLGPQSAFNCLLAFSRIFPRRHAIAS
ncbi:hypothetical protein UlMin_018316 [Ulmus minor]